MIDVTQIHVPVGTKDSVWDELRSLRFASTDPQTWGMLLNRNILRNNESSFWQYSSRITGRLNQEGDALGLEHISPGHNFHSDSSIVS